MRQKHHLTPDRSIASTTGPLILAVLGAMLAPLACGEDGDGESDSTVSTSPGPLMRPGWNCNATGCHFPDGQARPPDWGAAGTVFGKKDARVGEGLAGVNVIIKDARDREIRLVTNAAGNFFTPEPLVGPLSVALERDGRRIEMPEPAPAGSCNFCHTPDGDARGRIYAP